MSLNKESKAIKPVTNLTANEQNCAKLTHLTTPIDTKRRTLIGNDQINDYQKVPLE